MASSPIRINEATAITLAIGCGVLLYGFSGIGLGNPRPVASLYNNAIGLVMAGCLSIAATIVATNGSVTHQRLHLVTLSLWIASFILALALLLSIQMIGMDDDFSRHVIASWTFLLFAALIAALIFGPDWMVNNLRITRNTVRACDVGQAIIVPAAILMLATSRNDTLVEEFFSLWLGVMLAHNGLTLARAKSSFVESLSEQARETFLAVTPDAGFTNRPFGLVLATSGSVIALTALIGIF